MSLFEQLEMNQRSAVISPCGQYRYHLSRRWGPGSHVLWVMLNPSTADASEDDPTIRKCIGFTTRWGFGALEVVNLFAWRATDPRELQRTRDPVGEINASHLRVAGSRAGRVIAAWGRNVPRAWEHWPAQAMDLIGQAAMCLGRTANGQPRHPLMLPYSTIPVLW